MPDTTRRRRFDSQFKLDAVRLIQESDRSITDIANDLGVRRELLYKWKRELEDDPQHAFPGKGKLQQELKRVTEERDILKKALAFFSRNGR
jgi:transposase